MASASERWVADHAAFIREEVEAVRGKAAPRDKRVADGFCQGGEEHGVKVRDFAVVKQKVDNGEEALMVAQVSGIKEEEERKGT